MDFCLVEICYGINYYFDPQIASLDKDDEFTVAETVQQAKDLHRSKTLIDSFSASHTTQLLSKLTTAGFVYKNRHGKYAFAIPLLGRFIRRQGWES